MYDVGAKIRKCIFLFFVVVVKDVFFSSDFVFFCGSRSGKSQAAKAGAILNQRTSTIVKTFVHP